MKHVTGQGVQKLEPDTDRHNQTHYTTTLAGVNYFCPNK